MTNNWTPEELAKRLADNEDLAKENPAGVPAHIRKWLDSKATNKYRVAPKEDRTYNGKLYASKKEANFAQRLDLLVKSGDIDFYLEQVPFRLPGNVVYRLDFMTFARQNEGGNIHLIEVKGYRTRLGELKRKQTEALYHIRIEVV